MSPCDSNGDDTNTFSTTTFDDLTNKEPCHTSQPDSPSGCMVSEAARAVDSSCTAADASFIAIPAAVRHEFAAKEKRERREAAKKARANAISVQSQQGERQAEYKVTAPATQVDGGGTDGTSSSEAAMATAPPPMPLFQVGGEAPALPRDEFVRVCAETVEACSMVMAPFGFFRDLYPSSTSFSSSSPQSRVATHLFEDDDEDGDRADGRTGADTGATAQNRTGTPVPARVLRQEEDRARRARLVSE
jgi:hypothetical protein